MKFRRIFLLTVALHSIAAHADGKAVSAPDTVEVRSGSLRLHGLLWRPPGRGPFPAVLFNHGSGRDPQLGAEFTDTVPPGSAPGPMRRLTAARPDVLGPVFAKHGYVFLVLFRRGQGLSADQRMFAGDSLDRERAANGVDAMNRLQLRLLETDQMDDALAGLAYLRSLPDVDAHRIAAAGHSFGGSLTLLLAERDSSLRAIVAFAGAAGSWARSPELRARLLSSVGRSMVPTFLVYAANDLSVEPGAAMASVMARLGKPYRAKVYSAIGHTTDEGHCFVYLALPRWETDVFGFLAGHMRP